MSWLFLLVSLRDAAGTVREVLALSQMRIHSGSPRARAVGEYVRTFLDALPSRLPTGADAMRLLEHVAVKGVRFPGSLVMLSKVIFTLEGLLGDIAGPDAGMGFALARHIAQRWLSNRAAYRSPLMTKDWITLQCSALLYASRLWVELEQTMLDRVLPAAPTTQP